MATIQFENGTKVNFEGTPTPKDVEEVAAKLNLKPPASTPGADLVNKILGPGPGTGVPVLDPAAQGAGQIGSGVIKSVAGAAAGAARLGIGGLNYLSKIPGLGFLNTPEDSKFMQPARTLEKIAQPENAGQTVGKYAGDIGQFFIPGKSEAGIAAKGAELIQGLKVPEALKSLLMTGMRAGTSAAGMAPVAAVQSGGKAEDVGAASIVGAVGGGIGEGLSQLVRNVPLFRSALSQNIAKALGISGKQSTRSLVEKTPQAEQSLRVIADNATGAIVKDVDGVEKPFDPQSATFYEMLQAWQISRDKVFSAYDSLAKRAGDEGAAFTQKDFDAVISEAEKLAKDSTKKFRDRVASMTDDIRYNFGTVNPKDRSVYFKNTDLLRMQDFLKKVNIDVDPKSDAAGAEVSGAVARKIREIMDKKITGATGEGYQALRNQYSALKSVENDLNNQYKKVYRQSGGWFGTYVEAFGGVDAIMGLLTKSPMEMARGTIFGTAGHLIKRARDPEANLRAAFQKMGAGNLISPNMFGKILEGVGAGARGGSRFAAPLFIGGQQEPQ